MSSSKKKLGFLSILFLGINTVVGSGIFLLPGKIQALAAGWSLWLYVAVAVIAFAVAWCAAQCAALFQRNGGVYVYAKEAFGDYIGFKVGAIRWAVGMVAWASLAVGLIMGIGTLYPVINEEPLRSLILISFLGGLGLLNWLGIQVFTGFNYLVAIAKLLPLGLFLVYGLFAMDWIHFNQAVTPTAAPLEIGEASLAIFYAFGGFESLAIAAGEMKNPKRDLPVAIMVVMGTCALIYFLIHLVSMGILGSALANSTAPISDVAEVLFGPMGKGFVLLGMTLSMGGINLAASFITPRTAVALAEDRMIPSYLAKAGSFGTPGRAIFATVAITTVIACSSSFTELVNLTALARFVSYLATCSATLVFQNESKETNYFKQPWKLAIPLLGIAGIVAMLCITPSKLLLWGLFGVGLTVPLYFLKKYSGTKPEHSK